MDFTATINVLTNAGHPYSIFFFTYLPHIIVTPAKEKRWFSKKGLYIF